jgi:hypothetical protein
MPLSKLSSEELAALAESEMTGEERQELAEATEAAERGDFEPLKALGYRNMADLSTEELRAIAEASARATPGRRRGSVSLDSTRKRGWKRRVAQGRRHRRRVHPNSTAASKWRWHEERDRQGALT